MFFDGNLAGSTREQLKGRSAVLGYLTGERPAHRVALDGEQGRIAVREFVAARAAFMRHVDRLADSRDERPIATMLARLGVGPKDLRTIWEEYRQGEARMEDAQHRLKALASDPQRQISDSSMCARIFAKQDTELTRVHLALVRSPLDKGAAAHAAQGKTCDAIGAQTHVNHMPAGSGELFCVGATRARSHDAERFVKEAQGHIRNHNANVLQDMCQNGGGTRGVVTNDFVRQGSESLTKADRSYGR